MKEKNEIPKSIKTPSWEGCDKIRDHSNDPFILKKAAEAHETLTKIGFPPGVIEFLNARKKETENSPGDNS